MGERVAVILAEGTFGGGPDVSEDQVGGSFRGYSLQVDAVPCRGCRGEYARLVAEFRVCVVSYAKTIT